MRIFPNHTSAGTLQLTSSAPRKGNAQRGFSLIEAITALVVLALLATIGVQVAHSLTSNAQDSKLTTDVGTVNRAVTMYVASGGDLSRATTASDVLAKLKTTSSPARIKTQINPLTRSVVDPRLSVQLQSATEAASGRPRAYWNAGDQRFEVASTGSAGGVQAFILDDNAAPQQPQVESRDSGSMEFAKETGWIWDYKERWDNTGAGPTFVPTFVSTSPGVPPTGVPPTPRPNQLAAPVFSIPGGVFPATDFDLTLSLSNPNPAGSSHIKYSLGDGAWHSYSSSMTIPSGTQVLAKAVSNNRLKWYDSPVRREVYSATLIQLDAPTITLSEVAFTDEVSTITVAIADNNASGVSNIYFDIKDKNGNFKPVQLWAPYTGSFAASVNDFPEGFDVIAYAKAVDPDTYDHSDDAEASTTATFFGQPLSGDILFVIDASGSMSNGFGGGTRYEAAIQETVAAIWALDPDQRFSVGMFDGGVHWTDGSNELKVADQANKISMTFQIQSVDQGRGTNYEAALGLALEFDRMPETVIFLTDGRPNSQNYAEELAQLVSRGIKVDVFGIELDSTAMARVQAIANATGGTVTEVSP